MAKAAALPDARPVGVIDVGSHSVRLEIAQFLAGGRFETLEELSHPAPLGADVFTNGVISAQNIRLVGAVLNDFRRVLREYGVQRYRAVATSAVREAGNQDIFLHRIEQLSGVRLDILHGSEEVRLIFLAVREALGRRFGFLKRNALVFTVGTGASQISFLESVNLTSAETVRLGTLRLVEQLDGPVSAARLQDVIDPFVAAVVSGIARIAPGERPELFVAVGSPVRALVSLDRPSPPEGVTTISRQRFGLLSRRIVGVPVPDLATRYRLPETEANSLEPCCNMLEHFFRITDADRLIVPSVTTRDALIRDLGRELLEGPDPFTPQILSVATRLGQKYNCDAQHARVVADLVVSLFDDLQALHGLGSRPRLLLEVAALLHDIGMFVSSREHHKHSCYLVRNSEIPGISPAEQELLAVICRYHRRATPRPQHPEYMALGPDERVLVSKLAALLRVADALDRCHQGRIRRLKAAPQADRVVLAVRDPLDLTLEQWGLKRKADLFEEVFGYRVSLVGQS